MIQKAPNNATPINTQIKIFVLFSFVVTIVNIQYFHTTLLQNNGQPESDGQLLLPEPEQINQPQQQSVSKELKNVTSSTTTSLTSNRSSTTTHASQFTSECFIARNNTIHPSTYGTLKPPYINLGFPKMGTTSLHSFFACAGYRSMHYRCNKRTYAFDTNNNGIACADCIQKSVEEGLPQPLFTKCGRADAYSQLDNGSWGKFPQIEYLDEILRAYPEGTFVLTFRTIEKWYHSMTHWPPHAIGTPKARMSDGLRNADIPGFPRGTGRNVEEFGRWFCSHVTRVREAVGKNPMQHLVEIDIEDPRVGEYVADVFDVEEGCWGHVNANARLHPEVNQSKKGEDVPWFSGGRLCIRGKTGRRMRVVEELPPLPKGMLPLSCDGA